MRYRLDSSFPESQNGDIGTIPWTWGLPFNGIAIFSNANQDPFIVAWGPGPSEDDQPWCKLSDANIDPSKYESQKYDLARTLRQNKWEKRNQWTPRQQDWLKINSNTVQAKHAATFGDAHVMVQIKEVRVLDREIWQLQIAVKPVARIRENRKVVEGKAQ